MKKALVCVLAFAILLCGCSIFEKNEVAKTQVDAPESEVESSLKEKPEKKSPLDGKVIVVDPGHGINSYTKQEAIAPNSSETKSAFVSGTRGANLTEEQLNLMVALKLQEALLEKGAVVHMTRTVHKCDVSNIDRAELGNKVNADISVKLHADGNNSPAVSGVSMLVPGSTYITDAELIKKSRRAGELVLEEFIAQTNAKNRGISVRNDMTGFNWSKVPVILLEMGFMTNPEEDKLLESDEYQNKMVTGIVTGLERYFSPEAEQ